jgi:addiction module HigA family antidote
MIRNVKNLQKRGRISVTNSSICKKIIDLRKKNDWSQTTLAKKLGISKSTMSKIENGSRKITTDELIRLAEIFDSSSDYLLGLQNNSCPTTSIQYDLAHLLNSNLQLSYTNEFIVSEEEKAFFKTVISGHYCLKNNT